MPTSTPTCACPVDTPIQLLAKFNNNLALLFKTMSLNRWTGQLVALIGGGSCGCTETQILAALNNNIVSFFAWFSANAVASGAQAGIVDLTNGDASKAVAFATAFAAKPSVVCIIAAPDNSGYVISPGLDNGNVAAAGFTALFAGAVPGAGYKMFWIATPTTQ